MRVLIVVLAAAAILAGCGTAPYDPGPEPDARAILTPQIDALFPGAALNQGLRPLPAVPLKLGDVEIGPVRRAQALAPAGWMACLRAEEGGRRRYFATFFNKNLLVFHREALPPDRCEEDSYAMLRRKPAGR